MRNFIQVDIAVLGAGMAGLMAATGCQQLTRAAGINANILVCEKQFKPGGRLKTVSHEDSPFDPGAHQLHGGYGNPVYHWLEANFPEQLQALTLDLGEVKDVRTITRNGVFLDGEFRNKVDALYVEEFARFQINNPGKDTSLGAIVERIKEADLKTLGETSYPITLVDVWRRGASIAQNWSGAESPAHLSMNDWVTDETKPGGLSIREGIDKIPLMMAEGLKEQGVSIDTGRNIRKIIQKSDGNYLLEDAEGAQIEAKHVIVAINPGAFDGSIQAPWPDSILQYRKNFVIGNTTKITTLFDKGFFTKAGISPYVHAEILTLTHPRVCHFDNGRTTLFVGGGQLARIAENWKSRELLDFNETVFRQIAASATFGSEFRNWRKHVAGVPYVTNWNTTFGGAYPYLLPGKQWSGPIQENGMTFCGDYLVDSQASASVLVAPPRQMIGASTVAGAWFSGLVASQKVFDIMWARQLREAGRPVPRMDGKGVINLAA